MSVDTVKRISDMCVRGSLTYVRDMLHVGGSDDAITAMGVSYVAAAFAAELNKIDPDVAELVAQRTWQAIGDQELLLVDLLRMAKGLDENEVVPFLPVGAP